MLYSQWLNIWLQDKKEYINHVYANYSTIIYSYIEPYFGSKPLKSITEQSVQQAVLDWMRNDHLSCSTVKNIVAIIKSSLRAAQNPSS